MSGRSGEREDEPEASCARLRLQTGALTELGPDAVARAFLGPAERLLAARTGARMLDVELGPRQDAGRATPRRPTPRACRLYLTDRRLLLLGGPSRSIALDGIADVAFSAGRLLLALRDGSGVVLEVDRPYLLRVELAAARRESREVLGTPRGQPAIR